MCHANREYTVSSTCQKPNLSLTNDASCMQDIYMMFGKGDGMHMERRGMTVVMVSPFKVHSFVIHSVFL